MKYPGALLIAMLAGAPAVAAGQQDTLNDPVRAERLRQMVEQRFGERVKEQLGLTDDQAMKVRAALGQLAIRRRGMERQERAMRQALAFQLRPGVAADADSVARLVDALTNHRIAYAQTFRDEMRDLSAILNPVQRGQYLMMRDRLMQRVQELQQGRNDPPPVAPFRPNRRP
ncbi:MAG TPA: Spy/CpxP family protein refolding chaperone [Gemmatimonadales bacterium]|nr:Spy/CpxP family protein refolding chaperone [Gemmatimonadales bacterium]